MTLDDVEKYMSAAITAGDVFGEKGEHCKEMLVACHPDRFPEGPERDRATVLFLKLGEWKALLDNPQILKSSKCEYELGRKIAVGDIADVQFGRAEKVRARIMKIARTPGVSNLMAKEYEILSQLQENSAGANYWEYFPKPIETFSHEKRRVNVMDYVDLRQRFIAGQIREKHPELDGRHLVWMFKRMLVALGYAHRQGWVHGAVLPPHLLFNVENHGLQLLDWTLAVKIGQPLKVISSAWKMFYPQEVMKKKSVSPGTDIYMAATSLCWLAGGKPETGTFPSMIPGKVRMFLKSCFLESPSMRPQDAWKLHDEFDDMARSLYGRPKFCRLEM